MEFINEHWLELFLWVLGVILMFELLDAAEDRKIHKHSPDIQYYLRIAHIIMALIWPLVVFIAAAGSTYMRVKRKWQSWRLS